MFAEEKKVAVPVSESRVHVTGEVVSVKAHESHYGWHYSGNYRVPNVEWKMTVKVSTPEGVYLVWGSVPSAISEVKKGDVVSFDAKLVAGNRDESFGFFKRPTKSVVVKSTEEKVAA